MKKLLAILAAWAALTSSLAMPSEGAVKLDSAPINMSDVVSLQAGARAFVNYCLNCHSASMMRYSGLRDIGLTDVQIKDNLLFTADKVGEMMNVAMSRKDGKEWFGAPPPDLSVVARSRGADWLYTYLRGFYRDPSTATGWNNLVFDRVAMPHVLWTLQGERVKTEVILKDAAGKELGDGHGGMHKVVKLDMVTPGSLSPLEYDVLTRDLVNFLVWVGEPHQALRKQVGFWVLLVLGILIVLTWLLKKEYWKDVH
ncbi:MAG: cytochrome c1 [Betaproteobacteria bacterium]|nr:cytochrome c1 [Betaproteobacteria bacterium]